MKTLAPFANPEFARYLVAGGFAFAVDLLVLYSCTEILGIHFLHSTVIGQVVGFWLSYALNITWVFDSRRYPSMSVEFPLFMMIVLAGLCVTVAVMFLLVTYADVNYLLAKGVAAGSLFLVSYAAKKATLFHRPLASQGATAN